MGTEILGVGHFLPPSVEHMGVVRPIALDPVGPSTLAARATESALKQAGLASQDIDFIIFATATPDVAFPGAGVYLQEQLRCGTIGALDVRAQCAGFLYGLQIADQFIRSGAYARILLAGAEVHSSGLDESEADAATSRLFADGAGVVVLGPGSGHTLLAVDIHADGRHYRQFWCEFPASRQFPTRLTEENLSTSRQFPQLDREALGVFGVDAIESNVRRTLGKCGLGVTDIDRFIVSHVLPDVADAALERLGVDPACRIVPSRRHGHIMGGGLPVALSEAVASGAIDQGARVCLAAAGAGFAWGAAIIQW